MAAKKLNQVTILMAGIFLLALIIANGLLIQPFLNGSRQMKGQLSEEKTKRDILNEISMLQKDMKAYEPQFIQKYHVSTIIQDLNQMAQKSGVALNSVAPGPVEAVGDYERVVFVLQAYGKYHWMGEFISRVESYPQFLKIQSLDISTVTDAATKERTLKVVMRLAGYRLTANML